MTDTLTHTDKPKRRHRSPNGPGMFVTDLELAEILGIPEKPAKQMFRQLDQTPKSNFPKKQRFWGDRRFLPAVEEWLKKANGLKIDDPTRRSS